MKRIIDRAGWALAGALGLMLMLVAARAIQAGPLDPPGPVASTMKTLDNVRRIVAPDLLPANDGPDTAIRPDSSRAADCGTPTGEAVLDAETGLVWQRTPVNGRSTGQLQ